MINGKSTKQPSTEEVRLATMPEHELKMREAAAVVSSIVGQVAAEVRPGVKLTDLEIYAGELCKKLDAKPYNLNYKPAWARTPYPAILCVSVNDTIAHGIPNEYAIKEGDTVNIDTGIVFNGVCGDCAITVGVGELHKNHERLLKAAKGALYAGIREVRAGVSVTHIAQTIDDYAKELGFVTNQTLSGHGIGVEMHEEPTIPFFYDRTPRYLQFFGGRTLKAGQVICLEPMLTKGKDRRGKLLDDGWTLITENGKRSAMFEHMILVKEDGYEILTDHFTKG